MTRPFLAVSRATAVGWKGDSREGAEGNEEGREEGGEREGKGEKRESRPGLDERDRWRWRMMCISDRVQLLSTHHRHLVEGSVSLAAQHEIDLPWRSSAGATLSGHGAARA